MRKAVETSGESLARGMRIFLDDLRAGTVRMTSDDDFEVGKNLATTPGKVVFRNRLLEVIHYTPTTDTVQAVPIVIVTPWINKFYILDLNAKKSLVRYLTEQGFDVYITSWKNPGEDMRDVGFDDYLNEGIARIIAAAQSILGRREGAPGRLLHRRRGAGDLYGLGQQALMPPTRCRSYSATFLTTLVDYHKPGDIEVFLDEGSIEWLSRAMDQKGYLDGKEMASAFRLLRSNSLIWHYVVHGYLYGETPPPFDVLFWNMDTTRMPATMHKWYLREFYLNNALSRRMR